MEETAEKKLPQIGGGELTNCPTFPTNFPMLISSRGCGKVNSIFNNHVKIEDGCVFLGPHNIGKVISMAEAEGRIDVTFEITIDNKYLNGTIRKAIIAKTSTHNLKQLNN